MFVVAWIEDIHSFYFQTSIVFSLEEGPGVLFKALAVFALRNINLSKVTLKSWYIKSHFFNTKFLTLISMENANAD